MRPINPKAQEEKKSSDAARRPSLLSTKKQTLSQLSFKKKAPSITANPTITDADMAPRIPTYSPTVPPYSPAFATTPAGSPSIPALEPTMTMTSLNGAPSPTSTQGDMGRILSEPIVMSPIAQDQDMDPTSLYDDQPRIEEEFDPVNRASNAAEAFLQSIMPAAMAAPLEAETVPQEQVDEVVAPSRTSLATAASPLTALPGRIQKKWKWTGAIVMQPAHEPQTLCEATLFDTEQLQKTGMPFRVALREDEPLVFQKYLPLEVLEGILLASNPIEAVAFMKAKDEDNAEALGKWAGYLVYHKQIAMARVELDGMYAANIIVASSNIRALLQRLSVPLDLKNDAPLVAVLATWALPREKRAEDWRLPFKDRLRLADQMRALDTEQDSTFRSAMWDEGVEERKPNLRMAVRILRYPRWMHDHMISGHERQYCVWPPPGQRDVTMEREVQDLMTIMKEYQNAEYKNLTETNVRVVFIHSKARKTIGKIQNLIEWRAKRIDTMFVVFGSCSVPLHGNDWRRGFWEIYPIGGVLTFTAHTLFNDACQILHKVRQIGIHQLWTGYIIPTVLGMAVRLAYEKIDGDPLKDYDEGHFPFLFLLDAIDNGFFGLLRAPPQPQDEREPTDQWIGAQIDQVIRDPRDTLEFCLAEFSSKYDNVPVEKWKVILEEEISNDLKQMQIQPGLMEEYRRFVILCDEEREDTDLHGLEWVTPYSFEFRDDFDNGTPPPDSPTL
ncbi:hypothetical protein WG66_004157 [Moniliophthora roreri]|nr:hypothetical protein WG66_004157 [Moniliophthora roreri]